MTTNKKGGTTPTPKTGDGDRFIWKPGDVTIVQPGQPAGKPEPKKGK